MPRLHSRYARICVLMLLLLSGCGGVAPSAVGDTAIYRMAI